MKQVSTIQSSPNGVIPPLEPSGVQPPLTPPSPYISPPLPKKSNTIYWVIGVAAVAVLVLGGLAVGYVFGHTGQLSSTPGYYGAQSAGPNGSSAYPGGGVARARGYRGQVTAVSSTSLAVQAQDGSSKTFVIDGNTQVRNAGTTGSIGDVKTGATVSVRVGSGSSSASPTASLIVIAPSANPPTPTN
jgi:hypothetical protein